MHRINRVPHALFGALLLLGLLLGGGMASAQKGADEVAPPPRPAGNTLTVPVNTTYRLQMTRGPKQPPLLIATVINEKDQIARVTPIQGDPTTVQITGLQPGTTQIRLISQADPPARPVEEVFNVLVEFDIGLLRNLLQRAVPTAPVTPIPAGGNTVIMTGTAAHAEDIDTILAIVRSIGANPINAMRVGGVMQVQLDVVVARVSRSEIRRFAAGLPPNSGAHHFFSEGSSGLFGVTAASLPVPNTGVATIGASMGTPNGAPPNIVLAIFNPRQSVLLLMQALRNNNLAKLIAEPHLITLSGRAAHFNSGGQQAVPTVSGFGGTAGVTFQEFGTNLDFLPIVLGNGKIYLEVNPSITQLDAGAGVVIPGGGLVPGRIQQTVRTSIVMEDGQTFCIGGLIQHNVRASIAKMPVLGDMPFVGALFSEKEYDATEEELVVLVTPHLVDPMDCSQVPRFLPGQETRKPDDFELFLEGILEAPRGQREVNHGRRYVPAWKSHPSAMCYPCAGGGPGNANPCTAITFAGSLPTPACACPGPGGVVLEAPAPLLPIGGQPMGTMESGALSSPGYVLPAGEQPASGLPVSAAPVGVEAPR